MKRPTSGLRRVLPGRRGSKALKGVTHRLFDHERELYEQSCCRSEEKHLCVTPFAEPHARLRLSFDFEKLKPSPVE